MNPKHLLRIAFCCVLVWAAASVTVKAQVKIGGTPGAPHPSAILELADTSRGLLLPRLNNTQRNAIGTPAAGLLLYNTSQNAFNLYGPNNWQTINNDASEWRFDSSRKWIYLAKPLAQSDSIFYDTSRHKFIFADRPTYTNSLGTDIPAGDFGGKFVFKATASKSYDSISFQNSTMYNFFEVDNVPTDTNNRYTALTTLATVNPKAFQKPGLVVGIDNVAINAGNDTTFALTGINNAVYPNGKGHTEVMYGINNSMRLGSADSGNVGTMFGIYNAAIRLSTATGRIQNNLYGYYGLLSNSITTRTNGAAYGIFLPSVSGAALGNYAIFTNQGRNRFGDSSIFSNVSSLPRAFFDINNNTAMIVPTGLSASRPATAITGMLRFNTENGGNLETFNGVQWAGTIRSTVNIDIPLIAPASGYTATIAVPGASLGSSVSISPVNALDNGLIIAYARVSAVNTVEVRFNLLYGTAIDPPAQNYYVRVIQ